MSGISGSNLRVFCGRTLGCFPLTSRAALSTKKTCLHDLHVKHGGKMVKYAGFTMPVQYLDLSIRDSTKYTRRHVSIFDVSHMLQTEIVGKDREHFLESLTPADIVQIPVGTGTLSVFTNERGGICDDLILSKTEDESIYVVTNAGCIEKDLAHLQQNAATWRDKGKDVNVKVLEDRALIAIQGPEAIQLLRDEANVDLDKLYFMHTTKCKLFDVENCRITRCGYTGEDGFEVSVDAKDAVNLVEHLLNSKKGLPALAGLGARDALRLEAGLCLYGNDISESTTPVEAAISFVIAKKRRQTLGFPGAEKIIEQLEKKPVVKKRVGFLSEGRSPRGHLPILDPVSNASVGFITSGCPSPCLEKNVSMGYVDAVDAKVGRELAVDFGGKVEKITVTKMPFVPTKYHTAPKKK